MTFVPDAKINFALHCLHERQVVAFPTETVYGLGADAEYEDAVQKIFRLKGRPSFNPLIVHVFDLSWIKPIAILPKKALILAEKCWPGPLTMVLPLRENAPIAPSVTAGLSTIAIRIPSHPLFRQLLKEYGKPIAAPSANRSNSLSCTTADHVRKSFGNPDLLILEDSAPCSHGLESTIIDFSLEPATLLRHGALPMEHIEALIGPIVPPSKGNASIKAPGQLKRHYAPSLPLRLNASYPLEGEAFLNFGIAHPLETLNLSPSGSLKEAGSNLFRMLHQLDDPSKFLAIAVAPIPEEGLGHTLNDRLRRAATLEEFK